MNFAVASPADRWTLKQVQGDADVKYQPPTPSTNMAQELIVHPRTLYESGRDGA